MLDKILIIAPRDCLQPFDYGLPDDAFSRAIGYNSGNSVFWFAIQRQMVAEGVEVEVLSLSQAAEALDRINSEFQACVCCPANVLNVDFRDVLSGMAAVFSKFRIPVYVLGYGAQSSFGYDFSFLGAIRKEAAAFVSAVSASGGTVCCRGAFTGECLSRLGFREGDDYLVLGCPSLYMFGPDLSVASPAAGGRVLKPAVNGPEFLDRRGLRRCFSDYPESVFVSQDRGIALLRRGTGPAAAEGGGLSRARAEVADLVAHGRFRLFCDFVPWRDYLRQGGFDLCVGTRIHGNVAGILSGIPSFVFAKDSRVREMAEFFDIPHGALPSRLVRRLRLEDLLSRADYTAFNARFAARYRAFKAFMNGRGLPWGEDRRHIEARLSRIPFAGPPPLFPDRLAAAHGPAPADVLRTVAVRVLSAFVPSRGRRKAFRRRMRRRP